MDASVEEGSIRAGCILISAGKKEVENPGSPGRRAVRPESRGESREEYGKTEDREEDRRVSRRAGKSGKAGVSGEKRRAFLWNVFCSAESRERNEETGKPAGITESPEAGKRQRAGRGRKLTGKRIPGKASQSPEAKAREESERPESGERQSVRRHAEKMSKGLRTESSEMADTRILLFTVSLSITNCRQIVMFSA